MGFRKGASDEILSLLGEGVEAVGEISFSRGLRVDGTVKGKIRSEATLVIGTTGKVDAEATVRRISINGEFRGIIHAQERVEIHKDGKVHADLCTPCLVIEAGALFEGKCNMPDHKVAKSEEPALKAVQATAPSSLSAVSGEKSWTK